MKNKFLVFVFTVLTAMSFAFDANAQVSSTTIKEMISTSATGTSTRVLPAEVGRNYLLIVNNGSAGVRVKFGSTISGSEGVLIPALGNYEPAKAITDSVWVKSVTGTQSITILNGKPQ